MIQLLNRPWRNDLDSIASIAERSFLIAAPYIKHDEAVRLCDRLNPGLEIITLANINPISISNSVLDISALRHFSEASPLARIIALPNLHAKVFIADAKAAIVTSGNLTRSALDHNIEYGVLFREPNLVRTVREDMLSFARLGSEITSSTIAAFERLEQDLRAARAGMVSSTLPEAKRKFDEVMKKAHPASLGAQVGDRSKNALFGDAIQFVLAKGPQATPFIAKSVRSLLPDLCDDSMELIINAKRFGKAWKHDVRNAQQYLKGRGVVTYDRHSRLWILTTPH